MLQVRENKKMLPKKSLFEDPFENLLYMSTRPWGDPWNSLISTNKFGMPSEINQEDGNIVVRSEIPGVAKEDIDIDFKDGYLTIKGMKKSERKDNHSSEIRYGEFSRSFKLREDVDIEKTTASLEDGVLKVILPMRDPPEKKRTSIEIT